ncbi:GNAT family N-acetyltransferase [Brachybacterium sacelli]|uniref:Lysine N-acyltransferase MbtK n=1 Tax=Brachybacterium sacelli TaxID=173364 RepID=A0ABS4X4J5_9MICO|nr:GNAT family N-acetyltransferase [Brachybacterium sacelli]MBP2383392.1 siderophore synthetase component/RimJ/RimL family protein N-acetyltransferase [Brachybacterium sacelli]
MPTLTLEPVDPARDAPDVHRWLTHPRAHYWNLLTSTENQIRDHLTVLARDERQDAWLGRADGVPAFYVETYRPEVLLEPTQFATRAGDLGMHLLVAPPESEGSHGFTTAVMAETVSFCLREDDGLGALRLVVEPDSANTPILAKNAAAGFRVLREIDLTADGHTKRAALSVCTREDFATSPLGARHLVRTDPTSHLEADLGAAAHRRLVTKAISEFSHERLITPEQAGEHIWELTAGPSRYTFRAGVLPLEHWVLEEDSLQRTVDGTPRDLDVQELVLELQEALGLPDALVATYLEELASTFAARTATLEQARRGARPTSAELLTSGLQSVEAAMTEGHPGFLANNGRIGYSLSDYRAYAPESGRTTRLVWVAARRELSHLSLGEGMDETAHLELALSPEERDAFAGRLSGSGLDPADYHLLPLHPWQAEHRLPITFAPDVARGDLVVLGQGGDEHQPQQSLRTFFNRTRPGAPYVKVALAIQNMGFLRGLSPHYMRDTPAVNDWIQDLVTHDPEFAACGFSLLRERSALGYTGDAYHRTAATNPQRKMLAALWRENPLPHLGEGEQAVTMAALLHRDHEGTAFASAAIRASGLEPRTWLTGYLHAYLRPLVHALLAHDVVVMPHGENLILRMRGHAVVGAFLKDIGEEMAVVGPRALPAGVERVRARVDGDEKALSIFTDVFDGVLRHLSGILAADGLLSAGTFWQVVAEVLDGYEAEHPGTARGLAGDVDLRAESFAHSCLNRLQLRNTLQMVDLGDQASSLLYAGRMDNPVAREATPVELAAPPIARTA